MERIAANLLNKVCRDYGSLGSKAELAKRYGGSLEQTWFSPLVFEMLLPFQRRHAVGQSREWFTRKKRPVHLCQNGPSRVYRAGFDRSWKEPQAQPDHPGQLIWPNFVIEDPTMVHYSWHARSVTRFRTRPVPTSGHPRTPFCNFSNCIPPDPTETSAWDPLSLISTLVDCDETHQEHNGLGREGPSDSKLVTPRADVHQVPEVGRLSSGKHLSAQQPDGIEMPPEQSKKRSAVHHPADQPNEAEGNIPNYPFFDACQFILLLNNITRTFAQCWDRKFASNQVSLHTIMLSTRIYKLRFSPVSKTALRL
ncbi:hypothetical protein KEM48_010784 [Puccinia striiformis f. sp. tritici PST-130]|nr:hypothetical protein KEM48_010784 [Puccinia striiformis f. sp. tritici PST-130]